MDAAGVTTAAKPCGLTDGDLTTAAPATTPAAWAVVDLGRPVPAELVAVRGCTRGCAVEVSDDGSTFRPAGAAANDFGAVVLDGRAVASVRVSLADATANLREISVWGPRPSRPALRPIGADDRTRLGRPFTGGTDADHARRWLLAIAATLAVVVLLAAGFALGRRRPTGPRLEP
jgi:hypothetical protein